MIAGALLLAAGLAHAAPIKASGSLKELWRYSRSPIDARPYFLNLDRARLTLDAKAASFSAHADYDHEVYAGSFFRTPEYRLAGLAEPAAWLTMDQTISTSATSLWRHRLYRGWAGYEDDRFMLRFGRQRIAWGTGKFWNPTDILNPYQPTAVERDERSGVDALYARGVLGDLSQAELAYAPMRSWPESSLLARGRSNWEGFDLSLMGGKAAASTSSWTLGGDFAGNLGDGSLRGEWSYTDPKTRSSRPFWRAVLGYEYTFSSSPPFEAVLKDAAVMVEYFHNGAGTTNVFRYNAAALLAGNASALAKDYLGASYSKDLHPLVKLEWILIVNLDDMSHVFAPTLQWNALPDMYLSGGLQRYGGARPAEYGRLPNVGFLQAQYYF